MFELKKDSFSGYVLVRLAPGNRIEDTTFREILTKILKYSNFDLLGYFSEEKDGSRWYATTIQSLTVARGIFYS